MFLNNGTLTNRSTGKTVQYEMSILKAEQLSAVMDLQDMVYRHLPNKDVLATDTRHFIESCIDDDGFVIGVFSDNGQLVSYRFIALPKGNPENMGLDLKLPEHELSRVAHLETTLVHPDYRGNGLQSKTLQVAMPILTEKHIKHLICTVSPFNLFSLGNIMKNGLGIKKLTRKYGQNADNSDGLWRFILHRNLERVGAREYIKNFHVQFDQLNLQRILLASGYVGDTISLDGKMLSYVK